MDTVIVARPHLNHNGILVIIQGYSIVRFGSWFCFMWVNILGEDREHSSLLQVKNIHMHKVNRYN